MAGNWSAFVQYNYMGFGARNQLFHSINPPTARAETEVVRDSINVIKAGIKLPVQLGTGNDESLITVVTGKREAHPSKTCNRIPLQRN